jgi:hypothetical protein
MGIALGAVAVACNMLPEDLACEEAVAHLAECCPQFAPAQFHCEYHGGCSST